MNHLRITATLFAAVPTLLHAGESAPEDAPVNLLTLLQQGGWAMFPLGACSLAMLFLIVYAWRETLPRKFVDSASLHRAEPLLRARDATGAGNELSMASALVNRALLPALRKVRPSLEDGNHDKVESVFVESLEAEENSVGQWVTYLNVVAAVAPMIGLLGTVSGMISAFQKIGQGGMGRPELLAGDIGEALITTATGLVIGIPAMIAYFVMRNRLNSGMIRAAQNGSDLIDVLREDDDRSTTDGQSLTQIAKAARLRARK